jgi:hypothetical protein
MDGVLIVRFFSTKTNIISMIDYHGNEVEILLKTAGTYGAKLSFNASPAITISSPSVSNNRLEHGRVRYSLDIPLSLVIAPQFSNLRMEGYIVFAAKGRALPEIQCTSE